MHAMQGDSSEGRNDNQYGDDTVWPTPGERPLCVALIVCDDVIEDKRTGNKTLVGLFSNIHAPQLPALHPRMFVMASLTSGRGEWPFTLRILAPSGRELMRMRESVKFLDPLAVHDVVVELRNLPIEETGVHFVDLLIGSTAVANRRFTVMVSSSTSPRLFPTPDADAP
jgi:hypothetical protein